MVGELVGHEPRPNDLDIETQPEESPFADRGIAVLRSLAASHEDGPSLEVDVPQPK